MKRSISSSYRLLPESIRGFFLLFSLVFASLGHANAYSSNFSEKLPECADSFKKAEPEAFDKRENLSNGPLMMPPNTRITGPEVVCPGESTEYELQNVVGNNVVWTVNGGVVIEQNDSTVLVQWPNMPGAGPYQVIAAETDSTGTARDTVTVFVQNTTMACNDSVQISLDASGIAVVTPDQILEGTYNSFDRFTVEIEENRVPIGDSVNCSHVNRSFKVSVIGDCDGNSCWSTISVEDKLPPIFDCPDITDSIEVECTEDPDAVLPPTAFDNCGSVTVQLIDEERGSNSCRDLYVKRTWIAVDQQGQQSQPCMQIIKLLEPEDPKFPDDITWTCEQYAAFPGIVEATALHSYIFENAAAIDAAEMQCNGMTGDDVPSLSPYEQDSMYWADGEDLDVNLDPNYDDDIDNPINDSNPIICGTPTIETDNLTDQYNTSIMVGCPYVNDCNITPFAHDPTYIKAPIYDASLPIGGLEDADILAATGSGVPDMTQGSCPFSVTFNDQKLEACGGVDTLVIFKIFRTWTIVNWCTGESFTDLQVIKVVDKAAPVIKVEPITVIANSGASSVHGEPACTSTGDLPAPTVTDNCGTDVTVRIITPVGEAIYHNGVNGNDGGSIPAPGLGLGAHTITYIATDACGNESQTTVPITVGDDITPSVICREFTDVSLTLDGQAVICAENFDEGSYDNCGIDTFLVKRMGEPDSQFRDCLILDCDDSVFMVIMRVVDNAGNRNECMVEVEVNDKLAPTCKAPEDVWTTCEEVPRYYDLADTVRLNRLFGTPTYFDNCDGYVEELTPAVNVDMCGVGTIVRTFRAYDDSGNTSSNLCRQQIMIQAVHDYKITFPGDWEGACGDMENAGKVTWEEYGCDNLAYEIKDLRFDISDDGACYKIIRTWTILNWCSYDGFSAPIEVAHDVDGTMVFSEDDDAHGYYTYKQLIKIVDNDAPVVSYDGPTEFCSTNADCDGEVNILPDYDEDCTTDITIRWELDLDCDGSANSQGFGSFDKYVPIGKHCIRFDVTDGCGNTGTHKIDFEVKDCKKPTPVCHNGLAAELMMNGEVEIWAVDFDAGSFDYCNVDDLKFRINKIVDITGDGFVNADDCQTTVPTTGAHNFTCFDFGVQLVQMWVGDDYDNWDYCVTFIEIQDNMFVCGQGSKMGGKIATAAGRSVMDVKVELSGANTQAIMTDDQGMFEFANVATGGDYTVRPYKNSDPVNGVSTFDIYQISQHILNVAPLNSPYKLIAADANRTGTITTLDIIEIRKLILRVQSDFRNNTSWRFVDKNYVFPDLDNPFANVFPEAINYNNLAADELNSNFVAVKIGDINGDVITNMAQSVDNRTGTEPQVVSLDDRTLKAGELTTVRFDLENGADLLGCQFTFEFDSDAIHFENIVENDFVKENNFGFSLLEEGIITASWNQSGTKSTDLYFEMTFRATGDVSLKNVLKINSRYTRAEAFNTEGDLKNIELHFRGSEVKAKEFSLYQNKPNPFSDGTVIGFDLPESASATLTVYELSGKVLKILTANYPQGYNEIKISKDELNGRGVYYYRLETADNAATRKMLFLK